MEYKNFPGNTTPVSLYLDLSTSRLGFPSSKNEIYVIIGRGIFVFESYTWSLQKTDPEGMGGDT